jgi:site-specific DNA-methyltransferase (adenine-specific)
MQEFVNKIIEGDCIDILPGFADSSIDMILCDLPYAMTQNKWDQLIDLEKLWQQYKRIIKPNGVIALTGQHRFTGMLISSNPSWFKYKIVWIKSKAGNFLNANKQPLRRHEDICIFYKKQPDYSPQKIQGKAYDRGIRKDNGSGSYGKFGEHPIKNVDGKRFPSDILFFEEEPLTDWLYTQTAETDGTYHPTQKPVALGRWLIRTYSRPGETVLDNACAAAVSWWLPSWNNAGLSA